MEIRWIGSGEAEQISVAELESALARGNGFVWLLADHEDEEALSWVEKIFSARPVDIAECHIRTPVPKLHRYDDHGFLALNGLVHGYDARLHFQPIKSFQNSVCFATLLGPTHEAVSSVDPGLRDVLDRIDSSQLRPDAPGELAREIREWMLLVHEELIGTLAREVTQLEVTAMTCTPAEADDLILELFRARHDLQLIRTNAAQIHDLYVRITESGRVTGADEVRLNFVRQGFEHVRNTADLERDYLQELIDLFETRVSAELNRFVRQLTAWGAIGLAGTLIAGIYGMNFSHMPELDWKYGYAMALGLIALVGIMLGVFFRRRGWL